MGKRISLTKAILFSLEKTIDGYVRLEDFAYNPGFYAFGYERNLRKSDLSLALKRLREKGLVVKEEVGDEVIIKLTDTGRDMVILLGDGEIDWDGKWRLVIFDIPERRRTIRQLLRKKLVIWGFTRWQKSVWATKKNCTKQVRDFIKYLGIDDWVLVIESDNIGYDTK